MGDIQIKNSKKLWAWAVFLFGLLLTASFYKAVEGNDRRQLLSSTASDAVRITESIERQFTEQLNALQRLRSIWEKSGGLKEDVWEDSASLIYGDYKKYMQAIEYCNTDFLLAWLYPFKENEAAHNLDIRKNSETPPGGGPKVRVFNKARIKALNFSI